MFSLKRTIALTLAAVMAIGLFGCGSNKDKPDYMTGDVVRGNSTVNLENGGWLAEADGEIFFLQLDNDRIKNRLKKQTANGEIVDLGVSISGSPNLNVLNDTIYFTENDESDLGMGIFSIHTDGSDLKKLYKTKYPSFLSVVNDKIYFTNDNSIYKMNLNGNSIVKIIRTKSTVLNLCTVTDGWIYFWDSGGFQKIRTNGTEKTTGQINSAIWQRISGDWLYYANMDNDHKVWARVGTDGNGNHYNGIGAFAKEEEGAKGDLIGALTNITDLIISYGWIYYATLDTGFAQLNRMKVDGSDKMCLSEQNNSRFDAMEIIDGWLYYRAYPKATDYNELHEYKTYKIRLDGSENQQVDVVLN
jgi:hypothetical protein